MATRTRSSWKPRKNGQFDSRVGWKVTASGKRDQHKFRLGADLLEAKRRDNLLRQIWQQIEQEQPSHPIWTPDTLELAKQVANGRNTLHVSRAANEDLVSYVQRVHRMSRRFSMLTVLPEVNQNVEQDYSTFFGYRLLHAHDKFSELDQQRIEQEARGREKLFTTLLSGDSISSAGPTIHEALAKYSDWLQQEYKGPEGNITLWGHTKIKQVKSLLAHHPNRSIAEIELEQIETMIRYWRKRPFKQGTTQHIAKSSAENYISALKDFFKWLDAAKEFKWKKPAGFADIKSQVMKLDTEKRIQVTPEQVFTLEELVLLYQYGTPLDRLLILFGLNCGFGRAESASLQVQNVFLNKAHSKRHQEILNFASTKEQSFIKFARPKTGVYCEFLLFQQTVQGIEWALQSRKKQNAVNPEDRLLVNGRGEPFDKPTKSGNANQQIPNLFARLRKRITDDKNEITPLPFKMLRKTGGDLVKRFSDGEISGVFLSHGQSVPTDALDSVYATRPFGKVFHALQKVENYLQPMFAAAGKNPFQPQPQAYTSRKTIDQILELHQQDFSAEFIAKQVGKSVCTVQRHITKVTGPRLKGRKKKPR